MEQKERMRRVREELIRRAKARELIYYSEFLEGDYGVARGDGAYWKIGYVLTQINNEEHAKGRPLLSSVCVLKSTGMPESTYWKVNKIPAHIKSGTKAQKKAFWREQLEEVFKQYS